MEKGIKGLLKEIRFCLRDILINKPNRKRLNNKDFSIISSDCTAGCICKDLKVRMNSPTRNFYFNAEDYIKLCQNLEYYLGLPLTDDTSDDEFPYLTALCGDIRLFLVHFNTVEQAQGEWERRKTRVNYNNLFFIMNDRNGCTDKELKAFDELPYLNKVCFTHIKYPEYKSTVYIPGSENRDCLKSLMEYIHCWWVKRYYDYFDYVDWLNKGFK